MEDQVVIKTSLYRQYIYLAFSITCIYAIFVQDCGISCHTGFKTLLLTILLIFIIRTLANVIARKAVLKLDTEGIEVHDQDFYPWSMFESFKITKHYETRSEELNFTYIGGDELKISTEDLEKDPEEIAQLIIQISGKGQQFYVGMFRSD